MSAAERYSHTLMGEWRCEPGRRVWHPIHGEVVRESDGWWWTLNGVRRGPYVSYLGAVQHITFGHFGTYPSQATGDAP